jgi:CBS domain-containing protein
MVVKELAETDVKAITPDADLATAAKLMWEGDCGAVPVIDGDRKVIGMITDRDICIAAATRSMRAEDIRVRDVMSKATYTCNAKDDVRSALKTMRERRVRRLPVLDNQQRLAGMLSVNDLALAAEIRSGADVPGEEFLTTLKAISEHTRARAHA